MQPRGLQFVDLRIKRIELPEEASQGMNRVQQLY